MSHDSRSRLLSAAKVHFARDGFRGASVARIAADAGVTPAMINFHFQSKLGLYQTCLRSFGVARLEAIERRVAVPADATELRVRLELLLLELLELHLDDLDLVRILLRDVDDPELVPPELERGMRAFSAHLERMFAAARDHGVIRSDVDPALPAQLLYLAFAARLQIDGHRARVDGRSLRDVAFRQELVRGWLDVVLQGVLPREER